MIITKKKKVISVLAGLIALASIFFICANTSVEKDFGKLCVSEDYLNFLEDTRCETVSNLLDAVFFNEEQLFFERSSNSFFYSVVENDLRWNNPEITIQSSFSGVQVTFVDPDFSKEAIAANKPLRMIAYTDREYREYLIHMTTLPMMNIIVNEDLQREPVSCSIELFDNSGETGTFFSKSFGKTHIRGYSSSGYPKFPLRLVLMSSVGKAESKDASLLGIRENSRWVLYSPYNDSERVRNVFSTELWYRSCALNNEYGLINSARYKFLELFINGEYFGLYALGYIPDVDQLQVDTSAGEMLYKNFEYFNFRDKSYDLRNSFTVVNAFDGYGTETIDFIHNEYRQAGLGSEEEFQPLRDYCDYLNEDHPLDEQFEKVDMNAYLDFYLFQDLIQGADSAIYDDLTKNYLITAKKENDQFRFLFTPWDLDHTWGFTLTGYDMDPEDDFFFSFGPFASYKPDNNSDVFEMLAVRYRQLRENEWSDDAIMTILDEYENDIFGSGAYERDLSRWPDSTHFNSIHNLNSFRSYVLERLHHCDRYYFSEN